MPGVNAPRSFRRGCQQTEVTLFFLERMCLRNVMLKELNRGDNPGHTVGPQREQMRVISGDEELGVSRDRAFKDAVVVVLGNNHVDPLCGVNGMGNGTDGFDLSVGLLSAEAELFPQNTVELGQDERTDKQLKLPSADAG